VLAQEALAIGWLDRLVAGEDLLAAGLRLARRIAAMPAGSVAAVKRVVDHSLAPAEGPLVAESDALAQLLAAGDHRRPMAAFLAAGGQTRDGELHRMNALIESMLNDPIVDEG